MNLIWHIVKKDTYRFRVALSLWLLVSALPVLLGSVDVLFTAKDIPLHTLLLSLGFYGSWIQWFLLVAMTAWVLQEETLISTTAFWVTRPISPGMLMKAKALYIGIFLVLFPLALELPALALQGVTARDMGYAALEILFRRLEIICLAGIIAALTRNFGRFVTAAIPIVILQWCSSRWMIGWLFLDKYATLPLRPSALAECDSIVVAVLTILGGGGLTAYQYKTRNTRWTIRWAVALIVLMFLVQPFWRWDFKKLGIPEDPNSGSVALSLDKYSVELTSYDLNAPHPRNFVLYRGNLEVQGQKPGDVYLPFWFNSTLTLPGGKVLKEHGDILTSVCLWDGISAQWTNVPVSNGAPRAFRWNRIATAAGVQTALGPVRVVNPHWGPPPISTFLKFDTAVFKRYFNQPASFHADVDLVHYRYKVDAEIPLAPGAGFRRGSRSVTVLDVSPQNDGLQVKLQNQGIHLSFGYDPKVRKMLYFEEDNVFYLLENKKRGEAFLPEPRVYFFPVDLFQEQQPLRINREVLLFTSDDQLGKNLPKLDPAWLKDAVLVRVRMEPVGQLRKPLVLEPFSLTGKGNLSVPLPSNDVLTHNLGLPTIQTYPSTTGGAAPAVLGKKLASPGKTLLIDDFESGKAVNRLGSKWFTVEDHNKLGSVINPEEFMPQAGGCESSPKYAAHIWGHYGMNRSPFPYTQLLCGFNPKQTYVDLSGFSGFRFQTKGDGKPYVFLVVRAAVLDYANYEFDFTAPKDWTRITLPFADFHQPEWGKPIPPGWKDIKFIQFNPNGLILNDDDFDLWIDDVELFK